MSLPGYVPGLPGVRTPKTASHRIVFRQGDWHSGLSQGKYIDGTKARDPGNTGDIDVLRPGLLMGKVTSGGLYAPSVIGITAGALTSTATSVSLTAAQATELVRRVGATGTFKLTGPPTANGTVRTQTLTYSLVSTTTGAVTITATGINEVQTFNFTNSPAGTFRLALVDSSGVVQYTQRITYSGTAATLVANLQAATDAVLATNAIVWSGSAVTAIAATYSGTGYAALPQTLIVVDSDALTAGDVDVTRTTAGVDGRFVAGSFAQPTDGSEAPLTFIPDGYGVKVTDTDGTTSISVEFAQFPIAGVVTATQVLPAWPSDTGLQGWIRDQFNVYGKFVFDYGY